MKFDLFDKNSWENSKTVVTFTYDVEKKRIIYQTDQHDEEIPISNFGRFGIFYNPQIPKGKKLYPNLNFLKKSQKIEFE